MPINLADLQSYNHIYGTTSTPFDLQRTPGRFSGGSAAALASGVTGLDGGSDICGSIRNPAHYCGIYGHKPTWGVVSPIGHSLPGSDAVSDLSVVGPMARSSEDLALAMDVIAGPTSLDAPGWALQLPRAQKPISATIALSFGQMMYVRRWMLRSPTASLRSALYSPVWAQRYRIRRVPNLT